VEHIGLNLSMAKTGTRNLEMLFFAFDSYEPESGQQGGFACAPASHERIENGPAWRSYKATDTASILWVLRGIMIRARC
jgi:hypothetical protein